MTLGSNRLNSHFETEADKYPMQDVQKLNKIIVILGVAVLLLAGCATKQPLLSRIEQQENLKADVCLVIETKDLVAPIAMANKDQEQLKRDISKRTMNHLAQYFDSRKIKTLSGDDCLPENVKLFVNYMSFEVGNDSNDFLFLSWNERDKVKVPYKIKAEITLYNINGEQEWANEQLQNGIDLDTVIEEISTSAARQVAAAP
jgi:hypothetical protein